MYKNILLPSGIAGIYLNLCQLYFLPLSSPDVEIHPGRSSQSPADKGQHWRLQVCRPQVSHFKSHKCFSELVWNYTTQFYAPHDTQLALRWAPSPPPPPKFPLTSFSTFRDSSLHFFLQPRVAYEQNFNSVLRKFPDIRQMISDDWWS